MDEEKEKEEKLVLALARTYQEHDAGVTVNALSVLVSISYLMTAYLAKHVEGRKRRELLRNLDLKLSERNLGPKEELNAEERKLIRKLHRLYCSYLDL